MYLEPKAIEATLRTIASHQAGTTLVVNFVIDSDPDELTAAVHAAAAATAAASHEPVVTTYTVDDINTLLRDAGFGTVELMDAGALRARYLSTRPDLPHSHSTLIAVATSDQVRGHSGLWRWRLVPWRRWCLCGPRGVPRGRRP